MTPREEQIKVHLLEQVKRFTTYQLALVQDFSIFNLAQELHLKGFLMFHTQEIQVHVVH